MGGKLLIGIKNIYVTVCVRVIGGKVECFKIDSSKRQGCIMSSLLFNVYIDAVMKEVKMEMGRRKVLLQKLEGEWRLPRFLYADDLVFCGGSDKDLRTMVERFVEVYRRRGLKINAGKGKVMVVNGEEGLENKVYIDGMRLEWVSEFKYLGCVLGKLGAYETEAETKVGMARK